MSAAPSHYNRVTSFFSYEATYPTLPKSGASLDAEFNAVRAKLNEVMDRLAEIQRDDGLLANTTVHPQSLTSETYVLLTSNFNPRGSWETETTYDPGDLVERVGLNYMAVLTHASDDFDIDLAAGRWQAFSGYPTAAQVVFAPGGSVGSVSVQQAILELDGDVQGKQASDAMLTALAALEVVANQAIYFTDPNTPAVMSMPLYGRQLVASSDAETARDTLGLVIGVDPGDVVVYTDTAKLPAADGSLLTGIEVPDDSITANKLSDTLDLSDKTITLPAANTPILTKVFTSTQQTITTAGALTIPHGLGVQPLLIQAYLVNQTAEFGYTIGDQLLISGAAGATDTSTDRGMSYVTDDTNLVIRFGAASTCFSINRKDTGSVANAVNANWKLVLRAFA